jgi:hypothetical protein
MRKSLSWWGNITTSCCKGAPLNKTLLKTNESTPGLKSFVKLDLARDNIGRALRLKEIKHPLENLSILRGISYVRQFMLKRFLLMNVSRDVAETEDLQKQADFVIPNQYQRSVLKRLQNGVFQKFGSVF